MAKEEQITELATKFNQTAQNASQVAQKGLILGGQFVEHDKVIKAAISGKINDAKRDKVVDWVGITSTYVEKTLKDPYCSAT